MHGKLYFDNFDEVVEFLTKFTGKSTAVFNGRPTRGGKPGVYVIEFEGGH